jgi:hypothetical protein
MSIAKTVEEIVHEQPILAWSIEAGIINYSAAAEYIRPSVERRVKKKVSTESILMGLRRMHLVHAKELGKTLGNAIKACKYSIENGFIDIIIDYTMDDLPKISKLVGAAEKGENVSIIMGFKYASIVTDSPALAEKIEKSGINVLGRMDGLAIFRIKLPKSAMETPGVISIFTSEFAKKGVNIVELESSYMEIGYVIAESEIEKALDAFHSLKTK